MLPPLFPGGCCRHPGWASPSVVSLWGPSASLFSVTGLLGSLGFSRPLTCPPEPCRQVSAGLEPAAPQEQMRGRIPFPLSSQLAHSGPDAVSQVRDQGLVSVNAALTRPQLRAAQSASQASCIENSSNQPAALHKEPVILETKAVPRHAAPPQEAQLPGPQPQTPSSHRPWMCEEDFLEGYLGWSLFSKGAWLL